MSSLGLVQIDLSGDWWKGAEKDFDAADYKARMSVSTRALTCAGHDPRHGHQGLRAQALIARLPRVDRRPPSTSVASSSDRSPRRPMSVYTLTPRIQACARLIALVC